MTELTKIEIDTLLNVDDHFKTYLYNADGDTLNNLHSKAIKKVEVSLIRAVFQFANNNQTKTAKLLGVSRGTVRKKLKALGLI